MFAKETVKRVKNTLTVIFVGCLLSFVPFYFHTSAQTENNRITNEKQTLKLIELDEEIQQSIVDNAVDDTEIQQIKETLNRIEAKLDRLIEDIPQSLN